MSVRRLVLAGAVTAAALLGTSLALAGALSSDGPRTSAKAAGSAESAVEESRRAGGAWKPSRPWKRVARQLSIPVFEPSRTFEYKLAWVNRIVADPGCENDGREQLRAFYGTQAGRYVELAEGRPRYCHDNPIEAPVLRRVTIDGKRVPLYDANGRLALEWCKKGTTITMVADGVPAKRLVAIARSMKPVDRAPAKPCPS